MAFPPFAAIITAAGRSERFSGGQVKKEYLSIDGETVLHRAVSPFLALPGIQLVVVTCPPGEQDECTVALGDLFDHQSVPTMICDGDTTRQGSVLKALDLVRKIGIPVAYVAIHDGARCFVTSDLIIQTLATATVFGGAAPALPLVDAPKSIDEQGVIVSHLDRHATIGVQTPQIFHFPEILKAHRMVKDNGKNYIDDTEIFTDCGYKVGVCMGERTNRKITYLEEIPNAKEQIEQYLQTRAKGLEAKKAHEELERAILESKETT
ncbi:MAG: 2-C-methyl-D-erythritol 4-phosphate cytidylyltransferase [Spirochaetaceae bacterium]|nr:2-C-methyl-D-erythritol 4-phosphate cytidylyltransferase [Spirochaetaceae bacterium]